MSKETDDYKTLHHQAMELCDSADKAERLGQFDAARQDRNRAYRLESTAADKCPKDLEPTRSVLHRSAAAIAMQLADDNHPGYRSIAYGRVMQGLAGDPPAELIKELLDTLGDLPLRKAAHKLVDSVDRCVEDNTAMRRSEVADRLTYVLMLLGR